MSVALTIPQPRVYERGTGKDLFFGEQIAEQYTAESCAVGDKEISCKDITENKCSRYTALLACSPGCYKVSLFSCECCRDTPTGKKTCQCERAVTLQPGLDIEKIISMIGTDRPISPGAFPVGAAGTGLQQGGGGGNVRNLLILAGVLVVGYFLYQRMKKGS